MPPLRERREEIPHLSTFFLREASERLGKPDIQLSSETLDAFSQFWWPGNVRQLKNEIQRAVALSVAGRHDRALPPLAGNRQPSTATHPARHASERPRLRGGRSLASAVEQVERDMIQTALDRSRGNISETARLLGLTRRGLYLKLRRLGLDARSEVDAQG